MSKSETERRTKMFTKLQEERIINQFAYLNKRYDRIEERMEKAEAEGDAEKAKRLDGKLDQLLKEMDGIQFVLKTLGYCVSCNSTDDSYYMKKSEWIFE